MITPHSRYRINSQNSNLPWANRLAPQTLVMNMLDGQKRGILSGDVVRVVNPEGEMEIKVYLTNDILQGCVSLMQGAWSFRDRQGVEKGGAVNSLISNEPTLPSQGSRTHSVFVEISTHKPGKRKVGV